MGNQDGYLSVEDLEAFYGRTRIINEISFDVEENEICALCGRIGAGKTTTLRAILGTVKTKGGVRFKDEEISDLPTHERINRGIGFVPEDRRIIQELSVEENLRAGERSLETGKIDDVIELFPKLEERLNFKGKALSGGEQQMLAIGRALMADPEIVFMDEAFEGLARPIRRNLLQKIESLNSEGVTLFMIENEFDHIDSLIDRLYLIERGEIVFEGDPEEAEELK